MVFNGVPKGRLIPVYLTDDGDIYSILFKDVDQLESVSNLVTMAVCSVVGSSIAIANDPLNDVDREKFRIDESNKKEKLKKL